MILRGAQRLRFGEDGQGCLSEKSARESTRASEKR